MKTLKLPSNTLMWSKKSFLMVTCYASGRWGKLCNPVGNNVNLVPANNSIWACHVILRNSKIGAKLRFNFY